MATELSSPVNSTEARSVSSCLSKNEFPETESGTASAKVIQGVLTLIDYGWDGVTGFTFLVQSMS